MDGSSPFGERDSNPEPGSAMSGGGSFSAPERLEGASKPGQGRVWSKLLWILILASCVGLHVIQMVSQSVMTEDPTPEPDQVQSMELRYFSRVAFGLEGLSSGSGSMSSIAGSPTDMLDEVATGPIEQLRAAIVVAAALNEFQQAETLLQDAERSLGRLEGGITNQGDPRGEADADWFADMREDIRIVRRVIERESAAGLAKDLADRLEARHGDFGEMVRVIGSPESDPLRQRFASRGMQTAIAAVVIVGTAGLAILAGFVLGIVALVLLATGRLRRRLNVQSQWSHRDRTLLLEGFMLFLVGFVVVTTAAALIQQFAGVDLSPVLIWLLLLTPFWPLLRGMSWGQLHLALGWHANGKGVGGAIKEAWCGVVGYLAGLPIVVLGFLISLGLISILHTEPSHPAVSEAMNADLKTAIKLFVLASLWAPIVEETVFRGLLYYNMRKWAAPILAALVVAFLFAIIHPQGLALVPALMGLAVVFALMREWRGSIIGPMVAHGMHNAFIITTVMLLLGQ
ncbi:MAG: lysostaphin resistance A-like protein [Phycisphaerales bacterium]